MSFKTMLQEMKEEFGNISSRWIVDDDTCVETDDDLKLRCWASMPQELLTDILMRIEASESNWPARKSVVSCAAVCRNWRMIVKEIVKCPEVSGSLTFPSSLKQPGSVGSLTQCFIKRNRNAQTYNLYLNLTEASNDDGKFLFAAKRFRRTICTDYIISLNADDISKGSSGYVGKLRSNFLGTKFRVYDAQPTNAATLATKCHSSRMGSVKRVSPKIPAGNYPISNISYEVNNPGTRYRGPRQMRCVMNSIPANAVEPRVGPTQTDFHLSDADSFSSLSLSRSKSAHVSDSHLGSLVLKNKNPRWHQQLQCWCLNFNGRVTVASVKNFQLVASLENENGTKEHEKIVLQFGKIGKDVFTMDYQYPISAFEAFAICLSSFDTKITCE
ncbi:putative transcription factor TUBBY family [Helianthus annuus]|nr:putative transcription factor TUBBY family [Helianthus annuus]